MRTARVLKTAFLLGLFGQAVGCKPPKSPRSQPFPKDAEAKAACESFNLARDASWTATFIKSFIICATSSEDSFATTIEVLESLGEKGVQAGLDLLLWNPPEAQDKDPLLGSLVVLLDRGTQLEDGTEIVDGDKRWAATQGFLESLRPQASIKLLLELQKKGLLQDLWSLLGTIDQSVPQGFSGVMLRQILSDAQTQADLKILIDVLVKNPEAYQELKSFVEAESYPFLNDCDSNDCFLPETNPARTTAQHWLNFWNGLGTERQDRLERMLSQVFQVVLEQPDALAVDRTRQLFDLAEDSVLRTENIYKQFAEILQVVRSTSLDSFAPFIEGLNRVKDNPVYLDGFQEKVGSTYLQDLVQDFLWKGGQPQGCQAAFPGLRDAKDKASFTALYKGLANPSTSCSGQVPVLLYMSQTMGWECPRDLCSLALMPETDANYAPLLTYALRSAERKLAIDPWYLFQKGAVRDRMSREAWEIVKATIEKHPKGSMTDLLLLENTLAHDPRLKKVMAPDWLERWLESELLELSSLEDSFQGLFPDRSPIEQWYFSDADTRMSRFLFGLYTGGPGERVQQETFSFEAAKASWLRFKPDSKASDRDIAQVVAALRSIHAQAKNPIVTFKPELEKVALPWVGGLKNSPHFTADGKREADTEPLAADLLLDESAEGMAIRSRFRDQMVLASAALPKEESDAFQDWLFNHWIPQAQSGWKASSSSLEIPDELFERTDLKPSDGRLFALFLAQQFGAAMQDVPEGSQVNELPASSQSAKTQASRQLSGPASFGGAEWTSLWAFDSGIASENRTSLKEVIDAVDSDESRLKALLESRVQNLPILKQGQLNPSDRDKLDAHELLLMQLHLSSPLFQSRGQQYFVPAVGFSEQCPQKQADGSWKAINCPFHFDNFTAYRSYIQKRVRSSLCSVLVTDSGVDVNRARQMGFNDSPNELQKLCGTSPVTWTWPQAWVQQLVRDAFALGRNPKLKASYRQLPALLRIAKSMDLQDPKQRFTTFLAHTPILSGGASARVLQRIGTYQAMTQESPKLISTWLLYLSERIGNRGVSDSLKKLGSQGLPGSASPVQDLLGLVTSSYEKARQEKMSTLEYIFDLITNISSKPYARETLFRLAGKPYDPYVGILLGFTLPQAVKAGILADFNWNTYAPLRLMIQPENLMDGQKLMGIYDRDALSWFDIWERVRAPFPTAKVMGDDALLLVQWLETYFESAEHALKKSQAFMRLAHSMSVSEAIPSLVRSSRILNKSIPDLDNVWQKPYVKQMDALTGVIVKAGPMAWDLLGRLSLEGETEDLAMEAFLGVMRAPLTQDGKEVYALLQDARVGLRAPSLWSMAWTDKQWQAQAEDIIAALDGTERSQWQALQKEWVEIGPQFSRSLEYLTKNVIWKNAEAKSRRAALTTLSDTVNTKERWESTQKIFEAWVDDTSTIRAWREESP